MLEDEGMYLCEASNTLGNSSASATFNAKGKEQRRSDNLSSHYPCIEQTERAKRPLSTTGGSRGSLSVPPSTSWDFEARL